MTIPVSGQTSPPGSSRTAIAVLYGIIIALVASPSTCSFRWTGCAEIWRRLRDSVQAEVTKVQEASSLLGSANQRNLDALREELENAKRNADAAVGQAKTEALAARR